MCCLSVQLQDSRVCRRFAVQGGRQGVVRCCSSHVLLALPIVQTSFWRTQRWFSKPKDPTKKCKARDPRSRAKAKIQETVPKFGFQLTEVRPSLGKFVICTQIISTVCNGLFCKTRFYHLAISQEHRPVHKAMVATLEDMVNILEDSVCFSYSWEGNRIGPVFCGQKLFGRACARL